MNHFPVVFIAVCMCRYAGRAFETAEQAEEGKGVLMVKGLKSMWRQAAPILRTTLQGAVQRIIMQVLPRPRLPLIGA